MKVICIIDTNWFLTHHKIYDVEESDMLGHYLIKNDVGWVVDVPKVLFIPLEEHREGILNNLGI